MTLCACKAACRIKLRATGAELNPKWLAAPWPSGRDLCSSELASPTGQFGSHPVDRFRPPVRQCAYRCACESTITTTVYEPLFELRTYRNYRIIRCCLGKGIIHAYRAHIIAAYSSQIVPRFEIMQISLTSSDNEIIDFLHGDVRGVEIKGCDLPEITCSDWFDSR